MSPRPVCVCGATNLSLRVTETLIAAGVPVLAILEADGPFAEAAARAGATVVLGDAVDVDVLAAAGVGDARGLIATSEDDLHNLEIALAVRELAPAVRCVLRIGNPQLAVHARGLDVVVVDPAHLAAPSFVAACGDDEAVARLADGTRVRVAADGTVTHSASTPTTPVRRRPLTRWRALGAQLDRTVRIAAAAVLVIAALSTLVLSLTYHVRDPATGADRLFSPLDALYLTVSTLATVGYGDYSFATAPAPLKVLAIFLMLVGAGALSLLYAVMTNVVLSHRLAQASARSGRVRLAGHVIVIGLGTVGLRVVEALLAAGRDVVVVESDDDNRHLAALAVLRVPVLFGNGTSAATLERAALSRASAVMTMTSDDETNVEVALVARVAYRASTGGRLRVVVRVFDSRLAARIEGAFDIHRVRSVSSLAAPHVVGAALDIPVVATLYRAGAVEMVVRGTGGDLAVASLGSMRDYAVRSG